MPIGHGWVRRDHTWSCEGTRGIGGWGTGGLAVHRGGIAGELRNFCLQGYSSKIFRAIRIYRALDFTLRIGYPLTKITSCKGNPFCRTTPPTTCNMTLFIWATMVVSKSGGS